MLDTPSHSETHAHTCLKNMFQNFTWTKLLICDVLAVRKLSGMWRVWRDNGGRDRSRSTTDTSETETKRSWWLRRTFQRYDRSTTMHHLHSWYC